MRLNLIESSHLESARRIRIPFRKTSQQAAICIRRQHTAKSGTCNGSVKSSSQEFMPRDLQQKLCTLAATVTIGFFCVHPSQAAVETVAPQQATSFARALPQQPVNKGKIWLIFLAGATGLFGAALAIERNSTLFPAIAKANQAMAATKAAQKKKQQEEEKFQETQANEARSEDAVLLGLQDARSRIQDTSTSSTDKVADSSSNGSSSGSEHSRDIGQAHSSSQKPGSEGQQETTREDQVQSKSGGG